MINKRLIGIADGTVNNCVKSVSYQWVALAAQIAMVFSFANVLEKAYGKTVSFDDVSILLCTTVVAVVIKGCCSIKVSELSNSTAEKVKHTIRDKIYRKLLSIGASYHEKIPTSDVLQVAGEGVEQLESYFARFLPQLFYSLASTLTLFVVISAISIRTALVLLICVPLIPICIVAVMKLAKKLLSRYWQKYTDLGGEFLENLQGLTTLKIYEADEHKSREMNARAEEFRRMTMKVLRMQLNSIIVMDIIAFEGAAAGIIIAATEFLSGSVSLSGCIIIILLSADFFIPIRQLGSFFHVAMNGIAAADRIFGILDIKEEPCKVVTLCEKPKPISFKDVSFSYDGRQNVLSGVNLNVSPVSFVSIIGESGSGKSTLASILTGRLKGYNGSITIGGKELSDISEKSVAEHITLVPHNSYIFKGTVRDNLKMGNENASRCEMENSLKQVNLWDFLNEKQGIDTLVSERGSNLSGGQRQRLALARAILHDSPVYIFDEATSNIDVESENLILEVMRKLSETKTVISITHRLANAVSSDCIYVIEDGVICQRVNHAKLISEKGRYLSLWRSQEELEFYLKGRSV